jgi:hypothetical protein
MDSINYNLIYYELVNPIKKEHINKKLRKNGNLVKEWKKILRKYKIRLKLMENLDGGGYAEYYKRTIGVCLRNRDNDRIDYQDFLSIIIHEFAHFVNMYNNKYPKYHITTELEKPRLDDKKAMINTAYRAEKYTDRVAEDIMNKLYPNIEYVGEYTEQDRQWLLKGLKDEDF